MSSTPSQVVIIGAGGHAREVLDIFDACRAAGEAWEVLGYLVEPQFGAAGTVVNGLPVLGGIDWLADHGRQVRAVCGIGAPEVRHRLVAEAAQLGVDFATVIHPTALRTRWVEIGRGVVVAAGSILTNHVALGDHAHINLSCTISHDARVGRFATLAPGVHVSGNVTIGEGAYLGTGSVVLQRLRIGEWATVGAGAVVTADIAPNATAVGMPARAIKIKPAGWQTHEPDAGS